MRIYKCPECAENVIGPINCEKCGFQLFEKDRRNQLLSDNVKCFVRNFFSGSSFNFICYFASVLVLVKILTVITLFSNILATPVKNYVFFIVMAFISAFADLFSSVLLCAGLWLIFVYSGKNSDIESVPPRINTAFTMIRSAVGLYAASLIPTSIIVYNNNIAASTTKQSFLFNHLIFDFNRNAIQRLGMVFILLAFFVCVYFFLVLKVLSAMRLAYMSSVPADAGCLALAIINIVFSCIFALAVLLVINPYMLVSIIQVIASLLFFISTSVALLIYRNGIKRVVISL